ncbi:MAG: type I glyceraldehyde-3-phosphate dehydrogenase [Bacillota bacterium]
MVRVGINGFGRIGRLFFRWALEAPNDIQLCAVNDLWDPKTLAHLLKYDSNYGILDADVKAGDGCIIVNGHRVAVTAEKNPADIPWNELGAQIVVESTGRFVDRDTAALHMARGGVSKVIISAPGKKEDLTVVIGVNDHIYDPEKHHVISNASCTTNCLAPCVKVLHDAFTVKRGLMTTVHAYTNDQQILDLAHKDLRRARAAAMSIIPTTTGAAKAVSLVLPELKGKLNGFALRVPTSTVSIVDFVAEVEKQVTREEVNDKMKEASEGALRGILGYSEEPLVSVDYKGCRLSAVIDAESTMVMEGNLVKVIAWYDNEAGYSSRLLDLVKLVASKGL